jgi:lipoyl(octanoyl) transferase
MPETITVNDLGRMSYRDAWDIQERAHDAVAAGGPETIFIVEHTPVVTLGRRGETAGNLITSPTDLARQNVDFVHSDRGGDITYHALGQIVAYPIIRLADHQLSVSGYVHRLESIIIATLAELGIKSYTDPQAIGVWTIDGSDPAKIAAIGVRIRRGISLHGLALNVDIDLTGFRHIVPCGLTGRPVTSIKKILGKNAPSFAETKSILIRQMIQSL